MENNKTCEKVYINMRKETYKRVHCIIHENKMLKNMKSNKTCEKVLYINTRKETCVKNVLAPTYHWVH